MAKFVFNIFASSVGRGGQFLTSILMVRLFGAELFGKYSTTVSSLVALYAGAGLGLTYALIQPANGRRLRSRIFLQLLALCVPAVLGLILIFFGSELEAMSLQIRVGLYALFLLYVYYGVLVANLYYDQRFAQAAVATNMSPVAVIAVVLVAWMAGVTPHYLSLVAAFVAAPVIAIQIGGGGLRFPAAARRLNVRRMTVIATRAVSYSVTVAVPTFVFALVNTAFLLATAAQGASVNATLAVGFTISNLLMLVPNAVGNILLAESSRSRRATIFVLIAAVGVGAVFLYGGGFDLLLALIGNPVALPDEQAAALIVGAGGLAASRILFWDLLRDERVRAVLVASAILGAALSVLLVVRPSLGMGEWVQLYGGTGLFVGVSALLIWLWQTPGGSRERVMGY